MSRLLAVLAIMAIGCTGSDWPCPVELRTRVALLDSDELQGRMPGTAGYDSAAGYIARTLAESGVRPAVTGAGGQSTFLQPVPLVRNRISPGTVLELRTRGDTMVRLPHDQRTFLLLATGHDGAGEARAPVYVGRGLHAPEYGVDDLAGLDLSGRAVLMSASPPGEAELARLPEAVRRRYEEPQSAQLRRLTDVVRRGAASILLLPDRWMIDDWEVVSALRNRLEYRPVERDPGDVESPVPAAVLHADVVDRLFVGQPYHPISHAGQYRTFELADIALRLVADVHHERITSANIIGVIPGRDRQLRQEYVIVSTQLDGPGSASASYRSDGDAEGPAALLELAAALSAKPPRRSVLLAFFTAEGSGGWGSNHFLAHPAIPLASVVAAVHVGALTRGFGAARVATALAAPSLMDVARKVAAEAPAGQLRVVPAARIPAATEVSAYGRYREAGIPALLLKREREPNDMGPVADGLDAGLLAETVRTLRRLVVTIADAPKSAARQHD